VLQEAIASSLDLGSSLGCFHGEAAGRYGSEIEIELVGMSTNKAGQSRSALRCSRELRYSAGCLNLSATRIEKKKLGGKKSWSSGTIVCEF